ncbi:Glycosyl transferase family 2 [Natronorubrum sediminis]|uniref:Glycosyl transferase family 2 n=1 Tax=Natronorubrum sediminis TaxID=640943 RepID=A0A1H6FP29_9EURY|nr:glycosyltransferase [Natronorubrum sediminis]SEH11888.1 Glycosyl transferase family 2 [Natronorubrum sediminis]
MKLSVVVSTLNDREQLLSCLDALTERTPDATEIIVVNGPSSDGTSGVVRDRSDVDVLVEISERNSNVSRNAGFESATGEVVAFLDGEYTVSHSWYDAIEATITSGTDVVTGPVTGRDTDYERSARTVAGRQVTEFDGTNVAFARTVLEALDGFDEALEVGGERDCAHRVAGFDFDVTWNAEMAANDELGTDGGTPDREWGMAYHSFAYRLTKNYGPRPTIFARIFGSALRDGVGGVRSIVAGEETPTDWTSDGTDVVSNIARGIASGLRARYTDRSAKRNPHGISTRHDRAVQLYDRR